MADATEKKDRTALYELLTAVLKYVIGPVLAAALAGGYSHCNHQKTEKGYEALAKTINEDVGKKVDLNSAKIEAIEVQLPASQPTSQPTSWKKHSRKGHPRPQQRVPTQLSDVR